MPGSPLKRARREEAKEAKKLDVSGAATVTAKPALEAIPDAVESRGRARAPARSVTPLRPLPLGQATRTATDSAQAQAMKALAGALRPGITLRIERSRPTWAAGFLEDYPIEADQPSMALAELLEHLRDEHGGQHYRITAIGAGDQILYSGSLPVAGPVRDRGRPITRADWEDGGRATNPKAAPSMMGELGPIVQLVGTLVQSFTAQSDKSNATMLGALRDIARQSAASSAEIASALAVSQSTPPPRVGNGSAGAITDGLSELLQSVRSIEQVKRALGVTANQEPKPEPGPQDPLGGAVNEVTQRFISEALTSMMVRNRAPGVGAPPPPRRRPPVVRSPTLADGEIPDALAHRSGQPPASH